MRLRNLLFDRTRLDRELTRRQAVLRALAVSGSGPLGVLIANALLGELSGAVATVLLAVWAVAFAFFLLIMWGKVSPRRRRG